MAFPHHLLKLKGFSEQLELFSRKFQRRKDLELGLFRVGRRRAIGYIMRTVTNLVALCVIMKSII